MTLVETVVFSALQGITEFLPVSSSGHLNIFQHFFSLTPSLSFDIFLNTATLFSVLFYFRHQSKFFFSHLPHIIIASLPAALIGILFKNDVADIFATPSFLPWFFLITSLFVFSIKFIAPRDQSINYLKALVIGIFQAIAILPGVSRSGSTIFAALLMGLSPQTAFNFSFSLFIPASLGAVLLDFRDFSWTEFFTPNYLLAFVLTFFVGLLALSILKKLLIQRRLWFFAFYTFFLSLFLWLLKIR